MKIEEKRHGETARQYAYRTLRENIISLDLEPGAPFNDVEMSQMIGISRTPVREAVIQLSEESRIIEIFPQRGMRIALIDVELVEEARFLRLVLEKAAVELVCGQADEEDLRWMRISDFRSFIWREVHPRSFWSWTIRCTGSCFPSAVRSLPMRCARDWRFTMTGFAACPWQRLRTIR